MRRALVAAVLLVPILMLLLLGLRPELDPAFNVPLIHFYLVTFTSFAATVVSFLLVVALGPVARPRHMLAAVAFAVMGVLFIIHALTTPGALIPVSHPAVPAVSWSAWLTLFSGGTIFAVASFDRPRGLSRPFLVRFVVGAAVAVMFYISVVVTMPHWLAVVENNAAPWHQRLLFLFTAAVWLLAAFQFWQTWREERAPIDGALALVSIWLMEASISLHLFPLWNLSWWSYHALLLVSFLFAARVLFMTYEQARQFSLMRYYVAASLILTVLAALVTSSMMTYFAERILTAEISESSVELLEAFVADTEGQLPPDASSDDLREAFISRLYALPVDEFALYDAQGHRLYPEETTMLVGYANHERAWWQRVLAGETVVRLMRPDHEASAGDGYGGAANAALDEVHTVRSYIAIGPSDAPSAVLATSMALPQLTRTIMETRVGGLLIAAATMGFLFAVLLVVVRRADSIISARTEELAAAYRDLRQAEGMRDDLTHMIVHDLRTPLTTISASLGLLKRLPEPGREELQERVVERTTRAAQRLDSMIDDILTVSKIETGELRPRIEQVLLDRLLAERLDPFYAQAVAEDKTLKLECHDQLEVPLDPRLTSRVVDNLVNNAFKYTRPGGQITVSAYRENGSIYLSVRDDGEGIPDDYKEYIFQKFSQVPEEAGRAVRKGTGLGLAFCQLVVKAHHGRIWVDDAPGGGSEFKIALPA
jgi:signal transduction histidine kinase